MVGVKLKAAALTAALLLIVMTTGHIKSQSVPCPGSPPTRLIVGGKGEMSHDTNTDDSIPVRVHDIPGTDARIVGGLRRGVVFTVLDGPECKDGYVWYQVAFKDAVGWLAEGTATDYFVEPIGDSDGVIPATAIPIDIPTPTLSLINHNIGTKGIALYQPGNVDTSAAAAPYQVAQDFGNVLFSEAMTASQRDHILHNSFVVSSGDSPEFYVVYQNALANNQPLFITVDSLLHSYHLAFDKVIRTAEIQRLVPLLKDFNKSLLTETDKLYQAAKGSDWEEAAKRTVAYVGVAAQLQDSSITIPDYAGDLVATEIANISSVSFGASAVFPESAGEAWAEYVPSGHYALNDTLSGYFRAMTYYGRMTFRLDNLAETQSALLLIKALNSAMVAGRSGIDVWNDLYDATQFLTGQTTSPTVKDYRQIMDGLYGANADLNTLRTKGAAPFSAAIKALPPMQTIDGTTGNTVQGMRFMPPRFAWDDYVFEQLVSNNVGSTRTPRNFPSALDVFAAFGSERALQILDKAGATSIVNYSNQMTMLRQKSSPLTEQDWTVMQAGNWLWALNALAQPTQAGYPGFMLNQAYSDRLLYTSLSSYAELKHDTVYSAEQIYTPIDTPAPGRKSPPPEPLRLPNYVEPVPLFWARLAAFAEMADTGLGAHGLLNAADSELLKGLADVARRLQSYSIKELRNEPLTGDEQAFLDNYGLILQGIVTASADKPSEQPGSYGLTQQPNTASIVDLMIDYDKGRVLHIGTGRVFDIYTVVPINGKLYLAHGGVFSHYEFQERLKNSLTDESWREMVAKHKAPPPPDWTFSFLSDDSVDPVITTVIRQFQTGLVATLWTNPIYSYAQLRESTDKVDRYIASQLEPLSRARQYEGRQLVDVSFRDIQFSADGKTVTVVVRETWHADLHNSGVEDESDGPKIGERGPYTIDVTYTLTKADAGWTVTDVSANGQPPAWKNVAS